MISLELWMKIPVFYHDDSTLLFTDMDHCALENKANKYSGYISWLCFNKLTLHLDKTSYIYMIVYDFWPL